jgi:hypothetical protein
MFVCSVGIEVEENVKRSDTSYYTLPEFECRDGKGNEERLLHYAVMFVSYFGD